MQTNLPDIKQLLTDWYLLTLDNPLYAGALVLSAWLLTVFFYSIRLFLLKRKQRLVEQTSVKLQNQLDEALQDNKQSEEKLIEISEQLAKEQQLSSEFSVKVAGRNQKIVENIKHLASQFNLSEQLVASEEKPKAEFVWQQQDNIQVQLTDRLQAANQEKNTLQEIYNQEKEQFSKQNAQFSQLQKTLDLQVSKATQLEQDLSVQKLLQQQLKNEAEQILADKLSTMQAKHDLDVTALAADLGNQKELLADKPVIQSEVSGVSSREEVSQAKTEEAIVPELSAAAVQESLLTPTEEPDRIANKSDFVVSEPALEVEQEQQEPDYTKSNLDISGKFKGLFGKGEKHVIKREEPSESPEVLAPKVTTPEFEVEENVDYSKSNLDISEKFKNLFGKEKKQAVTIVSEETQPAVENELASKLGSNVKGKFKSLFAKEQKQVEEIVSKEKELKDKPAESGIIGKFKTPFTKGGQEIDPLASEHQAEVFIAQELEAEEPEESVFEPDYGQSNFHMPEKLKKLFGKS